MSEETKEVTPTASQVTSDANRITSPTPIEPPPRVITINGMNWSAVPGVKYQHNYYKVIDFILSGDPEWGEINTYRTLMLDDLWFLVYFGLQVPIANHKWWVDCCRDVEEGPQSETIDLWARDHGKSTIITTAEIIQQILRNPNETTCILSYTRDTAKAFFQPIKLHFESNPFLQACFPDVLHQNLKDSPQWSDQGFIVQRSNKVKECTLEAHGLTDGMPTGRHFDRLIYDDIVTHDMASSLAIMDRVRNNFDMSMSLGKDGTRSRVIGTPYHHEDALAYLQTKEIDGRKMYHVRKKPATHNGLFDGDPVWLSMDRIKILQTNKRVFNTQYLLDPTPMADEVLPWECVHQVRKSDVPANCIKLMTVDPTGGVRTDGREADSWGILVVAVDPYIEDVGSSKVYILDGCILPMRFDEGINKVVEIYLRNGWIHKLGVEKVGMQTAEMHVSNALRAKGRYVTEDNGMMQILRPGKGRKVERIESFIGPPLRHGLVHIVDTCPAQVKERLRSEMEKFPLWNKDDGLDALAYVFDLLKNYRLPLSSVKGYREDKPESVWDKYNRLKFDRDDNNEFSWMKN